MLELGTRARTGPGRHLLGARAPPRHGRTHRRRADADSGRIHEYGDKRLPLPGAAGIVAAAAAAICAGIAGHAAAAALAGAAFVALLGWLGLYLRIAAPINRCMTKAAYDNETPGDIRAIPTRWDSIITTRLALQSCAMALLIATLISS